VRDFCFEGDSGDIEDIESETAPSASDVTEIRMGKLSLLPIETEIIKTEIDNFNPSTDESSKSRFEMDSEPNGQINIFLSKKK
jgi:hypothetical protein